VFIWSGPYKSNIIETYLQLWFSCFYNFFYHSPLTLILLMWKIWWAPNNASRWQMGFNSVFKGLRNDGYRFHRIWWIQVSLYPTTYMIFIKYACLTSGIWILIPKYHKVVILIIVLGYIVINR
jgi:hypothetical protein